MMRQRALSLLLSGTAGVVATVGVLAVVAAAFALSFDAIRAVAVAAHIRPGLAWLYPVSVDGAMSVATVTAVVLRRLGRSALYPWLVVVTGAVVSIVANGLHAWLGGGSVALPPVWAVTLSAVPPVLLALSIHLLVVLAVAVHPASTAPTPGENEHDQGVEAVEVKEIASILTSDPTPAPSPEPADDAPRPRTEGREALDLFTGAGLVMPLTAPVSRVNGRAVR